MSGFSFVSARRLVDAYRAGRTDPVEVAQRVVEAVADSDRMDPPLRAFIAQRSEDVLEMAEASRRRYRSARPIGPLDGVPIAVKDEVEQKGYPTTVGTSFLGRAPAEEDSLAVSRLRRAGGVLLGKTNMHEAGLGVTGINPHHGPVRNPYDANRISGGSSSGSAAAVAAGFCPMALGADGGGSIRIPAALCGVVGIKPSYGRVSERGAFPLCWSVAHLGALAGTVEDGVRVLEIIAGRDQEDPNTWAQPPLDLSGCLEGDVEGLRVGICSDFFDQASPEVSEICMAAVRRLESEKAQIVDLDIDSLEYVRPVHYVTIGVEMATALYEHRKEHRRSFAPDTRILLEVAAGIPAVDYLRAQQLRTRVCRGFDDALRLADVIISPTTGRTAAPIRPEAIACGESDQEVLEAMTVFSFAANATGLPAVTVPVGYDGEGLPIGMQIMARSWQESVALRVAAAAESAFEPTRPERFFDLLG
jgi:Asp-tRNA(Asn)/Glu-tRNA(Gln) amidotransferase A subunit family amidase